MLLLVDDDDLFRAALADNLRDDGYQVAEYKTTRSIPITALHDVCILLIDWVSEHRSGLSFIQQFHETYPAARVVVITAAGWQGTHAGSESHLTFLPKPLFYDRLVETLRSFTPRPCI